MKMNTPNKSKIDNYLKSLVVSERFNNEIVKIRNKYKIPEYGLGGFDSKADLMFNFPNNWFYFGDSKYRKKFNIETTNFCKKYNLFTMNLILSVRFYIFYNEFKHTDTQMCIVEDIYSNKEEVSDLPPEWTGALKINNTDHQYPVAIRINPYATQRDIISFVRKNYLSIKGHLAWYKKDIPIGKHRNRKPEIEIRNDYIYENRNLPLKEIGSDLAEKGIFMDLGEIGKIISLEKKRRK